MSKTYNATQDMSLIIHSANLMKLWIIGPTGSGKSTLAQQLGREFDLPVTELDACFWEPGWTPASPAVFAERVRHATAGHEWIIEGNYASAAESIAVQATHLIWLDYSLGTTFPRLLQRCLSRALSQTPVCGNNTESLRSTFLSRDSLLLFALKQSKRNRERQSGYWQAHQGFRLRIHRPQRHSTLTREVLEWLRSTRLSERDTQRHD